MDESFSKQGLHWKCLFTQIVLERQQHSSALWHFSMLKPVHVGFSTCVFLQSPCLGLILSYPCFLCTALTKGQVLDYLGGVNYRGLIDSQRTHSFSTVPLVLGHGRANPKSTSCQFKGSLSLFLSRGVSQHYWELLDFLVFPRYLLLGCVRSGQVCPPFVSSFYRTGAEMFFLSL